MNNYNEQPLLTISYIKFPPSTTSSYENIQHYCYLTAQLVLYVQWPEYIQTYRNMNG